MTGCAGSSGDLNAKSGQGGYTMPNDEFNYQQLWKEVEDFNNQGLPKSALKVVEKIYKAAKDNNNAAEFIKAILHKLRFLQEVEEETLIKVHTELTNELKESRFPITPVLHSMLGEQYWNYYRDNRYRFLKRTTTVDIKQDDMRTWTLQKIVEEIVQHYKASLEQPEKAKQTKIDIYDKILDSGSSGTRMYRPTLFDFVAHRAIDFFMDNESGLTQPVYMFSLNKDEYFTEARDFAKLEITTRDPLSFHYYALTALQELIRFHLDDKKPDALVDVDLKRLRFLYREAVVSNKEIIYEKRLRHMIETYGDVPVAAEIYYELASLYSQLGDKYKPAPSGKDAFEDYKWHKKKARDLCLEAIKKFPGSIGAQNCSHLVNQIEARRLDIVQESAVTADRPFPALVQYQNLDKVYLKVVKTDRTEIEKRNRLRQKDMVTFYTRKESIDSWETKLPDDGDYQDHSAEIKVNALEPGMYILLASNSKTFDFSTHVVAYSFFTVSNIAYVHRQGSETGLEFYLLHRENGRSLAGVEAQVWHREYNRSARAYEMEKGARYQADHNGYFRIKSTSGRNYFHLEFIDGSDRLYTQRRFYTSRYHRPYTKQTRTFFFTDRGIYRPGQTLYFKGIMLQFDGKDGEKNRILPNYSTTVTLYDVNHQKVSELQLTSNEFGTFSGTFQLPVGRLNGNMRISDGRGDAHFSMEEYKRPKFQVLFDPLEETYKLDDMVTVKGKAAAYAGYNIDNADVKYRVVRTVFYPYRWCFWRYIPPSPQMEILNGVTKTDEKGAFEVTFKAVPDLTLSKKTLPAFNFTVYAEVTDINGETQRSTKRVVIGYTALKIDMDLPEELDKNKKDPVFQISSNTLSGDFVPAKGEVAIYRLKENGRISRSKYWSAPDKATMDKKDYYKHFPHDSFADEADFVNWEREKQVFKEPFDTAVSKELRLSGLSRWKTGKYVAEMNSKDRYGSPVKEIMYFTLYSPKEKKVPYTRLDWFTVPKGTAEPGENAVILFGSSSRNVKVIYEVEYRGKIVEKNFFTLQNEQKKIEIPILKKHRGNVGVHVTFVKHNRVFKHSHIIVVPWSDKDLEISFETFRDKLKPGEQEEWRLKIRKKQGVKGEPGEKAAAEMLATLYDASLDAFRPLSWSFGIYPSHYNRYQWQNNEYFSTVRSRRIGVLQKSSGYSHKYYDRLNWFGFYWREHRLYRARVKMLQKAPAAAEAPPPQEFSKVGSGKKPSFHAVVDSKEKSETADMAGDEMLSAELEEEPTKEDTGGGGEVDLSQVKARTAFQETAFFYPHLRTGDEGEVIISFTVPESLTKWKMMGFAHTKDLKYGFTSNELVTQKELMVVPNAPRFFREGDTLELTSKITNLSEKELSGTAKLMLFDAATLQPVDAKFKNNDAKKSFKAQKGQSDRVAWAIEIPDDIDTVTYRIVAQSGKFSDGEERPVPILKNRMLVTETMPLPVRAKQTKRFTFKKLVGSSKSTTIKHHKFTLEFTANPVWYAVQALPYMMEYPHECLEQIFSRFYANSIASFIVNSDPRIKRVFDIWKSAEDSNSLLSNLEKNQELKTLLLEETPWVLNARSETERKKRIALLFDLNKMASQMDRAMQKLKEGQMPSGAWPWFHGMSENRYITQYIVCGFAHLDRLKVINTGKGAAKSGPSGKIWAMLKEAVPYLDRKIKEDYDWLIKHEIDLDKMNINYIQVHYLYARSYFKEIPMDDAIDKAFAYYKDQAEKYWLNFNKYMQGMIALALNRYGNHQTASAIARSIKEHALYSEEMGMYWKESYGFYWYRMPIETHALLIETFDEILDDQKSVDEMRTWLLKQKQTQDWRTTKATAEACYALLLKGTDWLAESEPPAITIGKTKPIKIEPRKMDNVKVEAGTGYFKTSWSGNEVTPDMGHITVTNNNKMVAWGGVYWQYFENLDKITPAKTPLQLKKQLFIEKPSDTGPVLHPLKKNKVKIGDRVKVRIELRVDRTMEYVHMKDMRASGFEPENVISRYKRQDGLGYYESTKDASTNFFFDYLPKGTYVFEYPLRVSHAGDFSNGITTIQCMYAPEFSSHSEGVRVQVDKD
jgi:uncharacterized protein YfaS (alpha-2-macroglobulin family)